MTYLLRRGKGSRRRKAHICLHDPLTGQPIMRAVCGIDYPFNLTSNVPWGQPRCKNCLRRIADAAREGR